MPCYIFIAQRNVFDSRVDKLALQCGSWFTIRLQDIYKWKLFHPILFVLIRSKPGVWHKSSMYAYITSKSVRCAYYFKECIKCGTIFTCTHFEHFPMYSYQQNYDPKNVFHECFNILLATPINQLSTTYVFTSLRVFECTKLFVFFNTKTKKILLTRSTSPYFNIIRTSSFPLIKFRKLKKFPSSFLKPFYSTSLPRPINRPSNFMLST